MTTGPVAHRQPSAVILALASVAGTRSSRRSAPSGTTGTRGVTAVLVDVVVRDKRGQPVRDLTQADFEVLEDGVPQTIGSFTPVFAGVAGAAHGGGCRAGPAGRQRRRRRAPTAGRRRARRSPRSCSIGLEPEDASARCRRRRRTSATRRRCRTTSASSASTWR